MTIAHLSDIHFGQIAHPSIVDVLVEEVNAGDIGLVVITGDLTQRARVREFEAAARMIERIEPPTVVVPGNHDVYPWWYPMRRLLYPLRRYRNFIEDDVNPTFETERIALYGLNSAHGYTIKGGRIDLDDLSDMRAFFRNRNGEALRIIATHHHLTKIRALGRHDIAHRAQQALDAASSAGVDLILCGHLHVSHIEPLDIIPGRQRLIIASAGTATSNRGRKSNRELNFYNRIDVAPEAFRIAERLYLPDEDRFVTESETEFSREVPVAT
jgi:3',5'-cyclic AMP phosphodiesterase CpdA